MLEEMEKVAIVKRKEQEMDMKPEPTNDKKPFNENDAPAGYIAIQSNRGCAYCDLVTEKNCCGFNCMSGDRKDGQEVIFVKKVSETLMPEKGKEPMNDEILAVLEKEANDLLLVVREIERKREVRSDDLMAQVNKELQREFGVALNDAREKYYYAEAARNDYSEKKRLQSAIAKSLRMNSEKKRPQSSIANLPMPEGTVLYKWVHNGYYSGRMRKKSGLSGIFQVYREGDQYPQTLRWKKPSVGNFIVRLLNKNGKPGIKIARYDDRYWFKEGEKPEGAE